MTYLGVVLYGPPASGKSTVSEALSELDGRYTLFERLRVSATPKSGYRNITDEEASSLASGHEVIYENRRYGNRYLVDRAELDRLTSEGRIPILHLGQIEGVRRLLTLGPWLTVSLECSRREALARSEARGDSDSIARLAAWDETAADLAGNPEFTFDVVLYSERVTPTVAANVIRYQFEVFSSNAQLNTSSGENPPG